VTTDKHGFVHRLSAELKLGATILLIAAVALGPRHRLAWLAGPAVLLLVAAFRSGVRAGTLLRRLLLMEPVGHMFVPAQTNAYGEVWPNPLPRIHQQIP